MVAQLQDLQVHYPVGNGRKRRIAKAVDGIDLAVREREIVALVGESGCGKTTVARTMVRLQDATAGSVWIGGRNVTRLRGNPLRRLRRDFQMIFQDPYESLPANATALELVSEGLAIHRGDLDAEGRRAAALAALHTCGLQPAEAIGARRMFELSGGQRQRVAIASAIALEPRFLVADEPVSMLDVSLRAGVLQVLLDLREKHGIAILFITHDLALAGVFADRVAVLYLGRVVEQGPAAEVITHPRHPYTRALVAVIPRQGGRHSSQHLLSGEPPSPTDSVPGCRFAPRCPLYRELGQPDRCRAEVPALSDVSTDHAVACHFSDAAASPTPEENQE
ncbi:ABC transporter ATP-binding protein [soil metagenome]